MKNVIIILSVILVFLSCHKKIDEVAQLNTNIFDPGYEGEQWWVYEDVFVFTNSNNEDIVRMTFKVPQEKIPSLTPLSFSAYALINGSSDTMFTGFSYDSPGDYHSRINILYEGETDYCVELGMYDHDSSVAYNSFVECKSL